MYLREYEYLLAIARERNMHRAADSLYISQPALSRLLQEVESRLGKPLFERSGRELVPTEAGRAYLEAAEHIVTLNNDLQNALQKSVSSVDVIQILIPMIWLYPFLNLIIPEFSRQLPKVRIKMDMCGQKSLIDSLLEHQASIAFGVLTEDLLQDLSCYPLYEQEMVLAVPKGHPLEAEAKPDPSCTFPAISPQALSGVPFVTARTDSFSGKFSRRFFYEHKVVPNTVLEVSLTSSVLDAVALGIGVSFVPSVPLQKSHFENSVTYLSVLGCSHRRSFGLMTLKGYVLHPEEELLLKIAREKL